MGLMFIPLVEWQAGAAVYVAGPGGLDMQGCTFKDNSAVSGGADGSIVVTVLRFSSLGTPLSINSLLNARRPLIPDLQLCIMSVIST